MYSDFGRMNNQNFDLAIFKFINGSTKYCNKLNQFVSSEEIKKDGNTVRLLILIHILTYELGAPILSNIDVLRDFNTKERIKGLEALKEVQHPAKDASHSKVEAIQKVKI